MVTRKVYEEDVYRLEERAVIQRINRFDDIAEIVLDKTIFCPEGGGQPKDSGWINAYKLVDLKEQNGEIIHKVAIKRKHYFPKEGGAVDLLLDWDIRFDHMQRHLGEHILSGAFYRLYKGINRGFHMGEDYMTIDISLEGDSSGQTHPYDKITWDMAMKAEAVSNKAIWENLSVSTSLLKSKKEGENFPMRKALNIEENIRMVCVGDTKDPADCVACCGTHPAKSGEVGIIKIWKVEANKNMYRIYFDAGKRAYERLADIYKTASDLGIKYSCPPEELMQRLEVNDERTSEIRDRLYKLTHSIIEERTEEIRQAITSAPNQILIREYSDLIIEDLNRMGRSLIKEIPFLLLLVVPKENSLLLFSDGKKVNCGQVVKDHVNIYQGKGGGNNESARAIFPKKESLYTFIDLIEKHLR